MRCCWTGDSRPLESQGLHLLFAQGHAFADRLEAVLKARGFEPLIDRTEIHAFDAAGTSNDEFKESLTMDMTAEEIMLAGSTPAKSP